MKRCVYLAALLAAVLLAAHFSLEKRRLRYHVWQLEMERRRTAAAELDQGLVGISPDEKDRIIGIFRDIAQAYTNRDIMAMRIAMLKVPSINDHLEWDTRPIVAKPLFEPFHDEFLFAKKLSDFDSPEKFAKFIKANTEVALFLGDTYVRQKCFSHASHVEITTFLRLGQYEEKFAKEGNDELRNIAAKELEFWTAFIESSRGFTRQYVNWEVRTSTEYAAIISPKHALSRDKALEHARKLAAALLKPTGLSPAWLSEFSDKQPHDYAPEGERPAEDELNEGDGGS